MRGCRLVARCCRLALLLVDGLHAQEQPVRIIYPFAAGGSGDGLARLVGEKMRAALNRNVIVENRTGAAGRPGVVAVKNAAPDGSTLLITPIAPMAVYQHVYKNLEYDPIKDFAAVSQIATFDFALAVGPKVPADIVEGAGRLGEGRSGARVVRLARRGHAAAFLRPAVRPRRRASSCVTFPTRARPRRFADLAAGHVPMAITTMSDLRRDAQSRAHPHPGDVRRRALAVRA